MWIYITILSTVALAHANLTNLENQIQPRGSKIIGGQYADITEFPHHVSLRYAGSHRCGGSIYKSNIIITAAHCVAGLNREFLTVGAGSKLWAVPQQLTSVKKYIIHEKYNGGHDYDIAILVLGASFGFNEYVQPVRLADQIPVPGTRVVVSGWGRTENGAIPDRLKQVEVELVSNSQCQESYSNVTDRMLCAGVEAGGKDSCQGDSGGPLINAANRELLGVVSWGHGCAHAEYPGVYASVPNLYDWIVETVRDNDG